MGFWGKLLEVNLTDSQINILDLPEKLVRNFLGGLGLNAWLLHQNVGEDADPLGPENVLVFSCGLLTGKGAPSSARLHVGSRSPLTGLMGSSNVGGYFGAKLRSCGFQCILVRGRAQKPAYLWLQDEEAEISDASSLWRLETWETEERLRCNLGDKNLEVLAIGPAGENLVRFACLVCDREHVAGRTGMGAVMGSKNLKAIVVRGKKDKVRMSPPAVCAVTNYIRQIKSRPLYHDISTYGVSSFIKSSNERGWLATRSHRNVQFEDANRIDGKALYEYVTRAKACYRCPVHCKAETKINGGEFAGTEGPRPEYETVMGLGAKCGLSNPEALIYLNNLCNRMGIDTLSTGSVIAFAMDLYDRRILTEEDTGGLDLTWGNHEAMEALIYEIVRRESFGEILSEGVRRAARVIGKGSERFAYHVKGLELTGIDPRGAMGTALGYAVAPRGGDWTSVYPGAEYRLSPEKAERELGSRLAVDRFSTQGKGALIRRCLSVSAAMDSLGICKIPALTIIADYDLKNEAALTASLTGWEVDSEYLLRVGERVVNLQRLFNLMHGSVAADDKLPDKFLEDVAAEGPAKGKKVELEPMVRDFYRSMGWDDAGAPSERKLKSLGLLRTPARKEIDHKLLYK